MTLKGRYWQVKGKLTYTKQASKRDQIHIPAYITRLILPSLLASVQGEFSLKADTLAHAA